MDGFSRRPIKKMPAGAAKQKPVKLVYSDSVQTPRQQPAAAPVKKAKKRRFALRKKTDAVKKPYKTPESIRIRIPKFVRKIVDVYMGLPFLLRVFCIVMVLLLLLVTGLEVYYSKEKLEQYTLGNASLLLKDPVAILGNSLQLSGDGRAYEYNKDYQPATEAAGDSAIPKFTADFAMNPGEGVTITDVVNDVSITLKPMFSMLEPQKDQNRLIYPMKHNSAKKVYTLGAAVIKEDILLNEYIRADMTFDYELVLPSSTEARLEKNGSIGIYGPDNELLMGQVSTGSEQDAQLLEKARQNAEKTTLLFNIPAPFVVEPGTKVSTAATAKYELNGNDLKLVVTGLDKATYPLSIDPSVYIETAAKLMRGNNETNIDFDVDNELIQKSQTTGARIDEWSSTTNLSNAVWGQGTAVAGGYIYSVGGVGSGNTVTTTYNTAGTSTYTVPTGVTSITVKAWGAGGGGGAGNGGAGLGGNGGGGGYAKAVINVTPGEGLTVRVGAGGAKATANGRGGSGGEASKINRSATILLEAGAGGGGGGRRGSNQGTAGNAGAGGGATGQAGMTGGATGAAGGGTQSAGGSAGTGTAAGRAGVSQGGGGGSPIATSCSTVAASGNGSSGTGGTGGTYTSSCAPGGGGGGGYFGGGGGASTSTNNRAGGGGGGGSSYANGAAVVTGTDVLTVGALNAPGNSGDSDRGGLGDGGSGAATAAAAAAGDNGIIVISYTLPGTVSNAVYWAKFNTANNSIESPNPGTGVCSGWCNNSAYNLPTALTDLSLVAYNGYLYAIGGATSAGTPQSTVYIAKLGANGEPQLWHPTGGTQVYWHQDTSLSNARSKFAAVAYNNRIYVLGGLTTGPTVLNTNTVQSANINPMGTLGAWTSTGMQQLSSSSGGNRYGLTAHVYNNTLYIIGGDATLAGTPVANVDYSNLNSDGTMNSWVQTNSLGSGRLTAGGSYSTVFGAYMYVAGGCSVVDANGYCTTIATDVQIASINADGTLDAWSVISGLVNDRFAHTLIAWQGGLYRLGGCRAQDTGSGACTDTALDVDYGVINPAGEVSTVNITEPSGTAPCNGTTPMNCDLPPTGDNAGQGGQMLSSTVVLNGYLYVIGGCTNYGCSNSSGNTSYVAIGSDGSLQKPSICNGTSYGAWCVDNTNRVNGTSGVSAAGVTTFNNRIYVVGGIDETATGAQEIFYNSTNPDGSLAGAWGITTFATAGVAGELGYTYTFARANPSSAGSNPGNLYILGGCSALSASAGCSSSYNTEVYKCNIATNGSVNNCSTTGQLQLDTELATETNQGLGLHSGTVYANYIYLIGGYSDNVGDRNTIFYAKIDDNNNIVDAESGTANPASDDDDWIESTNTLSVGRRRGWAFGYNGHIYAVGGYDASGTGIIPFIEWSKMNVSNGSIDPFVTSSVTINQRWGLSMVVNSSYAYVIGGCDVGASPGGCSSFEASVQTFQLYNNNSGSIANFVNQSDQTFSADTDRWGASSAVLNGYLYVAGGCISATDCTNATNSVQYAPISAVDGSIGAWAAGGGLPSADRAWGSLEAAGGTLYYIGGQNDAGTAQTTVYYTSGISSGNPTWTGPASNGLPSARTRFGSTVWDDRIYIVGGVGSGGTCTGTVCDTVFVSPKLSSGGNITSAWATSTTFNVDRSGLAVTSYANNLYIFGGHDGTNYLSDVQFASLGYKTGTISQSDNTVTGDDGASFNSGMVGSTIQYTADGSKATITGYTDATHITVDASKTVSSDSAYTIQDGSVGAWSYTKSLPGPLRDARAVSADGYIYLVGGRSANTSCLPKVLIAPISANTTILSGNNPTGVGEWYETNVRYGGGRYGVAAEYVNGKIYTMGGGCTSPIGPNYTTGTITQSGTTVTAGGGATWTDNYVGSTITYADASTAKVISVAAAGTSMTVSVSKTIGTAQAYTLSNTRHHQSTLNSQPQVAIYSRMIDTDTDVFPTKWLMNGLDNSIGARWQLSYQSMHDTNSTSDTVNGVLQQNPNEDCGTSTTMPVMTTWGQTTNVGDVILGTPGNYTPRNGSGGNINCARYYYFKISIDASKTFGYPEDVNRGPTISDLSLYYTADPSKRMRHGKTFTGGEQQPLDTPF